MKFRCTAFFCIMMAAICNNPGSLHGQSPDDHNLNLVIQVLTRESIPFERRFLLADYGGFGSSILVRSLSNRNPLAEPSQGSPVEKAPSRGTFVLAVPLHSDFAVSTALAMAEKLADFGNQENLPKADPCDILIAFLGDEKRVLPENFGGSSHKGLRDLISLNTMPEDWVICYLEFDSPPEELVISHGIRGYVAPLDIIKPLPSLCSENGIPFSFRIRYNEIFKLGLVEGPDPIYTAWEDEINCIVLSGNETPGIPNGNDAYGADIYSTAGGKARIVLDPEKLALLLSDYASTIDFPVLDTDKHYSIYTLPGGKIFFLTEGNTTAILMITWGLFLSITLIFSSSNYAAMLFHLRLFFRYIWIFLVFLLLFILSIKAAGIIYSLLLSLFNVPFNLATNTGAALSLLLAILLFMLPSPLLGYIKFPGRARFYGSSSILFTILCLLMASFLDFSYVPVFLWTFLFISLGATISNPVLVFICILLAPIFTFGALINILETGSVRLVDLFFAPNFGSLENWLSAIMAALLILPIILLSKYGIILLQKSSHNGLETKPNRKNRLIIIPALIIPVLGLMLIQAFAISPHRNIPERRLIEENKFGNIIDVSLNERQFQDSRIITLKIGATVSPVRFDVSLQSGIGENILPAYSSQVPFERDETGGKINFHPGEFPPNPLSIDIVVPQNFNGFINISALYNSWDPVLDTNEKPSTSDYVLQVSRNLDIGS